MKAKWDFFVLCQDAVKMVKDKSQRTGKQVEMCSYEKSYYSQTWLY